MDSNEIDDTTDEARSVSRRTMIKGTAGLTAAVWVAPALTTLGARASAASLVPQCSRGATFECGGPIENCGTSGPLAQCICDQSVEGNAFCWEDFFCGGPQCTSSTECPTGYACVTSCCGTTCAPACGTNSTTTQTAGKTASGH